MSQSGLRILVIDDERPALDELTYLLERDDRVAGVLGCNSATEALRMLQDLEVDAVFLDIQMPGLTGLDLAQVLSRFRTPPPIVFVTAHEEHAVSAFELAAVDYVLKPVRAERLAEAVRRVVEAGAPAPSGDAADRRRARRGDPLRAALRHHPRGGPGRLRPPAHQRGLAPGPHPAVDPGRGVGPGRLRPHPPLPARLAPAHRGGPHRRRTRARWWWPGRSSRSAGGTPASCASCSPGGPRERARATGPGPGHRPPAAPDRAAYDRRRRARSTPTPSSAPST